MSDPQRLALAEIDRRYGVLRLAAPPLLRQLRGSVPIPVIVNIVSSHRERVWIPEHLPR